LKIAIISTYPPIECGIATYTSYLAKELKSLKNEIHIVSQFGAKGKRVYAVFKANDPDLAEKISKTIAKINPEVVHIQHEYGLYGGHKKVNIISLLHKLKSFHIPLVITLHTVYEEFSEEERLIIKELIKAANAVIVHHHYQKEAIRSAIGNVNQIYVIPHGVRVIEPIPRAKRRLGLEGKKVVLLSGYLRASKGFERMVSLFPRIAEELPEAVLVIAGGTRFPGHSAYKDKLFHLINESPVRDKIRVLRGPFPQPTFDMIFSAADVVVFPYLKSSQSGIMAHCISFGKPAVTSNLKTFRELTQEARNSLIARDDKELASKTIKILKDDKLRKTLSENAKRYAREKASWKIVAGKVTDLYHRVM